WTGTPAYAAGKVGAAFDFNGVDNFVSAGSPPNLSLTGTEVTIEGWIRPTAGKESLYFGKTAYGDNPYALLLLFVGDPGFPSGQLMGITKAGGTESLVGANPPFFP